MADGCVKVDVPQVLHHSNLQAACGVAGGEGGGPRVGEVGRKGKASLVSFKLSRFCRVIKYFNHNEGWKLR